MKKLHTALKVGGYYDDELVELNNRYDRLLEDCQELRRRCTLRPPRPSTEEAQESNPSAEAPLGAWPQLDGSDSAFNPGSFPDRGHLVDLMQRLVMPQSTPPLELLAETARQEVLEVLKPQHTLEAVQGQLRAFFQRRRLRLTLQCELIASRMRNVRHWSQLHRDGNAAALQRRLRRLSREIEAADARIKRLGEESTRRKRPEVQQEEKDRPIPKSCTKKKLFDYNEVYRETASTRIFRNDLVVCLREMVWNDRTTRTLRRFLLQVRHLPVTHRQELWRSTLQLAQKGLEEGDALRHPMLWQPRKQLASTLMDMARRMRIPALLEQDSGHTLASNVAKMFPEIFAKQEQEFQFASYPQLRRVPEGAHSQVSAKVYRLEDAWLDLVPLQPHVSLHSQEQRAVMRGRMEGPVGNDPGCGLNDQLQKELHFLSADARSAEACITQLAKERAEGVLPRNFSEAQRRHLLVDIQGAEEDESSGESSGMESPEHLLKAFLMMRHLSARNLRRELLGLLNLFRFAQQKISHGVLLLQASATNGTRSNKKDIFGEKPEPAQEQPLLPGHLPPSFPLAFPVSCRGMNGPRLHEALEVLSEAEYAQTGANDHEDVVDGNGLKVVHSSAISDLKVVEQELLIIASYALDKVPEDMKSLVDCAGLLKEVLRCEVELCRSKWKLVKLQLSAFERASLTKWDIAQRIMDVLARRPCFDVATGSFRQGYAALIAALESRAQLQQTLTEYQLRSEEMSLRKLRRQAQVALRCGRRLELDLGHQRERASREAAKQPTELAGPEMEEDPQLCIEDMLANPMEGLPPVALTLDGLLDFSDSLALVCQLDAQVSSCAERLFDLAPEPCFRHRWEEACCKLMAKEWQDHVAQAAASSPGISSSIGIRGLSNEARGSNVFWGDQAEDPNWLLLQAEQVILKWQSEDSEGAPGPCRLKDPELAWAPFNEAVLRLSCRLLDQVRMRRQLLDTLCEVRALEAGLGRQAQLVGTIENLRISETLPDLSTDFGEPPTASAKNPAPLLAAEAMLCFGDLDLSTGAGVRNLLQVDQMSELHHVVQHQISGKWLLVGCLLYNALLGDSLLRRSVDVSKGAPKWSGGRPWPPPEEFEESPPKMSAKSMQWPGTVRTVVYTQVGASIKETVRGLSRQIEVLGTDSAKLRCMVIYRCRSLGYSSLFMLERACDLLLRVQAAQSCAGLRCFASMLPSQLSPLKLSVDGRRRMLLESDGTVQSILHIPQVEEVLYLRGTECPSIGRHVRDCEVSMPEPFAQIMQVEEAARNVIPHDHPVLPPQIVVGSSTSAWAHPTVEIAFTGTAVSTMLLLREICAITALAMFSASMSGDEILLLQALHAVEAAWGNKAQRAAAEHVLSQSMLDTAQIDSCERHPKTRGLEQRTWDALEHVRADFLHLEAQVKGLKEERFQVKPVLQLLRQQHRFLKLGALVLCREAWHAAVQKNWLPEAAELQRWALHLEGFPLEGGSRLALAASAMPEMIGMPQKEFPSLTEVMAGHEEADPVPVTEFEALADEALERLWMSSPMGRAPFPADLGLEDEIKQAEACLLPAFKPEDCPHLHPLFHALCLHFAAPYDFATPFSNSGEVPAFVPLLPGRGSSELPRAMCRALLMLPGKMRRQVADIHLRMEMECDLLGKGGTDPELLEETESLVQTRYAVQRLRQMATTFLLLVPPTPTPKGFRQAEELLARELRCREEEQRRKEQRDTNNEDEPPEEPVEGSQSVEQLKAKQVLIALEMAIKVAGEAAAAAERAAEFEGDWLIMAKGGPGAQNEQEAGRLAVKNSLIECHDAIVHTVGIIVKCGLRFAAAGIERLKRHMEICLSSEGGKAALAFAQHLLSRANFVQTFCKDGQNAWIIKHSDLQESLQEIGRRMLQWAIVSTADQVASGRERIAQKAHGAQQAEEKLLQVRLALWHQRRDIRSMLNAMVSDRVPREIFELDRLHRSHRAICSAALEAEHRCCVSLHEQIVEKLGSLDDALSYSQNCFRDYRKEMHQGVQLEMRNLKQLLSNQLLKMQPQTLTVQNALKRIDKDDRDDPQVGAALKRPEPVQPQSAASTYFGTPASESYVEAAIIGPKRPALRPGAQLQRKAALEEMHHEIAQMLAAGTRVHTFYDLKCQQLKQYYDEELHRLCGTLSSNREVWENVSEGRERQRLLAEEIARSQRRCEDANGEAKVMRKAIDEHEEYTKKMFHWKRKMMKAQGDLQHEMRKYERDGLVDVSKMESELGKLDAQLQQLSTSVPAEQIIDLIERRGRTERMDMKRTMKHEGYLLHKAAAKVQVIRSELEKGAQDQEDEPFAELLMEECNTLSRQIMELDQENKDLQSQLLKTGEIDLIVYQPRAERPQPQTWQPPPRNVPEIFRDTTFEQELCFSVSFMKPPRGSTKRKQIDGATQSASQISQLPERLGKSESFRGAASSGLTPRKLAPRLA